tara:strand:- start:149 stop:643 length:495 start_codon:yes stop_codon:yes gene_type:complete
MNHYSINEEEALKMLFSVHRNLRDKNDINDYTNYSFISSWSNNYNSWKISKNINKILIKYEDLESKRLETFLKILKFVNKLMGKGDEIDNKKLKKSISSTDFEILKKKEKDEGFEEAVYSNDPGIKKPFFNLGSKNDYRKLLKIDTVKLIEKKFEKEMIELGYL